MAKTTRVNYEGIWPFDGNPHMLRTTTPKEFIIFVSSFENGVATIVPKCGNDISGLFEVIAGCFNEDSNFGEMVLAAFDCKDKDTFKGIKLNANPLLFLVTAENADENELYKKWREGLEVIEQEIREGIEAYMKTPEYRSVLTQFVKDEIHRLKLEKDVLLVDETTEMEFSSKEQAKRWGIFVELNQDDEKFVTGTRRWAKYMQHLMKKHNKGLNLIADNACMASGVGEFNEFMYGCAVNILVMCWKHGEELYKWWYDKN